MAQQQLANDSTDAAAIRTQANLAFEGWVDGHKALGLEPWTRDSMDTGREFLAEGIIRGLEGSSRGDVLLVGIGLVCGLAASIWGTWLP